MSKFQHSREQQWWLAFDDHYKDLRRYAGVRVQQPKPVTTRPKLHMSRERARLVGLRGKREGEPLALLPALYLQKGIFATAVPTSDSNSFEGPGRVGQLLQLDGRPFPPGLRRFSRRLTRRIAHRRSCGRGNARDRLCPHAAISTCGEQERADQQRQNCGRERQRSNAPFLLRNVNRL